MKYWVFDLDGTLVDSLTIHFQTMEKVFQRFGLELSSLDRSEILKLSAKNLPKFFENKFGQVNQSAASELFERLTTESASKMKAFPGIIDLLQILNSQGVKLAVWTARDLEATERILKSSGLIDHFLVRVTGSCVNQGKPHPEGLQKVAEHFQCLAEDMIMVGDFDSDMLGARAFGVKAIRVLWHSAVEKKKCEIAFAQFDQVADLKEWVCQQFNEQPTVA